MHNLRRILHFVRLFGRGGRPISKAWSVRVSFLRKLVALFQPRLSAMPALLLAMSFDTGPSIFVV